MPDPHDLNAMEASASKVLNYPAADGLAHVVQQLVSIGRTLEGERRPEAVKMHGLPYIIGADRLDDAKTPAPEALSFSTLESLTRFVKTGAGMQQITMRHATPAEAAGPVAEAQGFAPASQLDLHIVSPTKVVVLSPISGPYNQRFRLAEAVASLPDHHFDQWVQHEEFIIWLASAFERTDNMTALLDMVSALRVDEGAEVTDNGYTQNVTMRTGAVLTKAVALPNPLLLRPFSTFADCYSQPERHFVLRVRKGSGSSVGALRLIPVGNFLWRNTAINAIRSILMSDLSGLPVNILG